MNLHLHSKRALIAGGSSGIGLATATQLAAEGCELILVGRNEPRLLAARDALARGSCGPAKVIAADLSTAKGIGAVAGEVPCLDILVNSVSAVPPGGLLDVDDTAFRQGFDLKLFGYVGLIRALYGALTKPGGVVINVIGAQRHDPGFLASATAGAALVALTATLAKETARDGIRVVGVSPGMVETSRGEQFLRARAQKEWGDPARWRDYYSTLPFGRAALPDEIASAITFLASPRSNYTNGAVLTIDGAR
jgi:NAD(P)-dependent dehydrogenase (short-subunit alcohol dehydrogenase family)